MSEKQANGPLIGAEIVVKSLEQRGVTWAFGFLGAKIDKVFNTLEDSSIQTIVCRQNRMPPSSRAGLAE